MLIVFDRESPEIDWSATVPVDAFISIVSFFVFLCGAVLVFAAWPPRTFRPTPVELLALTLGGVMVVASGYGLGMVLA